ncbi:MAG: phosphate ABC transporter permease subunit PstC [Bacteroidales bacterium]|jgi:phosphate transport system permease protein|nr:phosphate ABC transporter permease subunit PstC [Bacteroidales bacterium]
MKYRIFKDKITGAAMAALVVSSLFLVVMLGLGLLYYSIPVLKEHSISELLFTSSWQPSANKFGFLPFIISTVWVTGIAIVFAVPISLLSAIFLTEYSKPRLKKAVFPVLDVLASLPSVIYGLWGSLLLVPIISRFAASAGISTTGNTILAGGIVLGVMILPLLVSLFVEIFSAVPVEIRDTSVALGATRWQTVKKVLLKKTISGILASVVLAVSRALGETIAVLMVCGGGKLLPLSPLDSGFPIPALIASAYSEMGSEDTYKSALLFAALLLFIIVFLFNLSSRIILYRIEKRFT